MHRTQVERSRRWKAKNKAKVAANQRAYRTEKAPEKYAALKRAKLDRNREWFNEYKKTLCCSRCPENHPVCLQFHHRDRSLKRLNVSRMVGKLFGLQAIKDEIAKCDVLCANCHAKLEHELGLKLGERKADYSSPPP